VAIGGSGATIDMEALSGMLGYPVMGPDGRTYSGRRPAQQGKHALLRLSLKSRWDGLGGGGAFTAAVAPKD